MSIFNYRKFFGNLVFLNVGRRYPLFFEITKARDLTSKVSYVVVIHRRGPWLQAVPLRTN